MVAGAKTIFVYRFGLLFMAISNVCSNPKGKGSGFWLSVPKISDLSDLLWRFTTGGVAKNWQVMVGALGAVLVITKDWKRVWKDWLGLVVIFQRRFFYLLPCLR